MSDQANGDPENLTSPKSGVYRFAAGAVGVLVIWLFVLPALGRFAPVSKMIDRHREAGVDPSIMFYTEIDHLEFRDGMLRAKRESDRGDELAVSN